MSITTIVNDVDRLVQRRAALVEEIAQIDAHLERVRVALTATVPQRTARLGERQPRHRLGSESSHAAVLEALGKAEPQSTSMLKRTTGIASISIIAQRMVQAGKLFRKADLNGVGRNGCFWYARSPEAFSGSPDVAAEPSGGADDELGQS